MATRVVYFMVDGIATIEKVRRIPPLLEMPDGYHPITNDSVWQDAKRMMDPLLIIIQRVRGPYGGTMENDDVSSVLYDIKVAQMAFKKPKVSKMWMRALERFMDFIVTKGIYIGVIAFALYFIAQAMFQGV